MMFSGKEAKKKPAYDWVLSRPCSCGSEKFLPRFKGEVWVCGGCGLLYEIGFAIDNPVMKRIERIDGSTGTTTS